MSVSGSGQASGSSAPAPLYTSTIPLAKPPYPLRDVIGREGVQVFDTFTFDEASYESADKLDHVLAKYEFRCLPQRNETYERHLFNKREQEPDESIDQFCTALMRLSEYCGFATLRDSLIRNRLILGGK